MVQKDVGIRYVGFAQSGLSVLVLYPILYLYQDVGYMLGLPSDLFTLKNTASF